MCFRFRQFGLGWLLLMILAAGLGLAQKLPAAATAAPGQPTQPQAPPTPKACESYKQADAEGHKLFLQILSANSKDIDFRIALQKAQRTWLAFREAHVESLFPNPDPRAYGTGGQACQCEALDRITRQRIAQMKELWGNAKRSTGTSCAASSISNQPPASTPAETKATAKPAAKPPAKKK